MASIQIAKGSESCAMAGMLANLLEENLKGNPRKKAALRAMNTVVVIKIVDIDLAITLDFNYGNLTLFEGIESTPHVLIETESAHVMELSNIPMRFGMPNLLSTQGKDMVLLGLKGKLKMKTRPWHLLNVLRLTQVMAIDG